MATNGAGRRKLESWTGPSPERLREILDYDPDTGEFRWKIRVSNARRAGSIAGTVGTGSYIIIRIGGTGYPAHTLAWIMTYEEYTQLDHKNRVRHDNRIDNLRPATTQQNGANKSPIVTHGYKGVTRRGNRYIAQITVNYVNTYLGSYDTPEEAYAVYKAAAKEAFGEFADE